MTPNQSYRRDATNNIRVACNPVACCPVIPAAAGMTGCAGTHCTPACAGMKEWGDITAAVAEVPECC
jgi:hypothetical protein